MDAPIYVINLDRDTERLASISANLGQLGLAFERIPAVLGAAHVADPTIVDLARYPGRNRRATPRAGEVGCYLSHIRVFERFLESGAARCVVLEDDVECLPALPGVLRSLFERDDWDLAKLFCFHAGCPLPVRRLAGGHRLCVHLTRTTSSAGYALNRRAAEVLRRTLLPLSLQVDHALDRPWESGLRVRGVRPLPVRLAPVSGVTTIGYADKKAAKEPNPRLFLWRAATEACRFTQAVMESGRALLR